MIEVITISKWKEISDLEINFPLEIFRGQADADWSLSSSIERCLKGSDWEEDIANVEFWFIREFRRKARQYLSDLPDQDDIIGWLSIMQHHGTPTRLIDFSRSFYVACYFALINAKSDSAVWAIDPSWLINNDYSIFNIESGKLLDEWEDNVYRESNKLLNKLFSTASSASSLKMPPGVVCVEPFHSHQRLNTQQGLFILPFDIQIDILKNLESFHRSKTSPIKKIIIKYELRETVLGHLRAMNITSETLFPGIDGFAKSIIHKHLCL